MLSVLLITIAGPAIAQDAALPVTASSTFDDRYLPEYAFDGKPDTRWASRTGPTQPEWLVVDLGESVPLGDLTIHWEAAYAVEYELQVSTDGKGWTNALREGDGQGGVVTAQAGEGRYVRVVCSRVGPFPLYSIWEITSSTPQGQQALAAVAARVAEAREVATAAARERLAKAFSRLGLEEIVFAVRKPGVDGHWYANFGYYARSPQEKLYRPGGGRLCKLNAATSEVTDIVSDPDGCVRDPQLDYSGKRIIFSYLKGGTENYHLYEINVDGTDLRQLTDGDWDDIEPTYLPDGGIVFCSSRCNRWVNCWLTPVAVLYRCDGDGSNVRVLSSNVEHDNTPWVLPDGRVLYMRWEYIDRSQVHYHHLWTANPDGTEQMVFFGNMHPGIAMLDAKPIPGTRKVLSLFSPGHGQHEHQGQVTIIDAGDGPDNRAFAKVVNPDTTFRDPYPLDESTFLVARGPELLLMDASGAVVSVYRLPAEEAATGLWCHEPRPLRGRPRERAIPDRVDVTQETGTLILTDFYDGRNMEGVERGDIKKLLVLESLPKPINYTGGMDPLSYGGTFTLERVVGTVPVEPDGSAYMELPASRSFFFVALDAEDNSVKRMQSFLTVQPGEAMSCVGCHEQRTTAVASGKAPLALKRPPSRPAPVEGLPEVFDFPRDIQPILDRHCVRCHGYEKTPGVAESARAGGVILTGDHGPMYSHSYFTLTLRKQFVDGRNDPVSNLPPRSIGAVASPLMHKLRDGHHGVRPSAREIETVRYWIESGAAYPGTYGALGSGSIGGYYANALVEVDFEWPETKAAAEAIDRRCASCHTGAKALPRSLSDERGISFWRPNWNDPRLRLARHIVFNLSRPESSLMLLAPLSKEAGGWGLCEGTVFADTGDVDYRKILAMCEAGRRRLHETKRFDMPGFRPPEPYLREMARYGMLAAIPGPDEPVDCYALDEAYFRSQWHVPNPRLASHE